MGKLPSCAGREKGNDDMFFPRKCLHGQWCQITQVLIVGRNIVSIEARLGQVGRHIAARMLAGQVEQALLWF